jgi:hypothetical protein
MLPGVNREEKALTFIIVCYRSTKLYQLKIGSQDVNQVRKWVVYAP